MKFDELIMREIDICEKLHPATQMAAKLNSAKIALDSGVSIEAVAEVLKLRLEQLRRLQS